jgi:hypothetical protein
MSNEQEKTLIQTIRARLEWNEKGNVIWIQDDEGWKIIPLSNSRPLSWGGRGIRVCERWDTSFLDFLMDMGPKPSPKHSLDRFPNNETGHYEPGNVRWATKREQGANTRKARIIEHAGESLSLSDWARRFQVTPAFLFKKLKSSLSTQDAFSKCIKNPPKLQ